MNQRDLIKHVALQTDEQQVTVSRILKSIQETIKTTLANNERVSLAEFGTFEPAMTRPRRALDLVAAKAGKPNTLMEIAARRKVKFRESKHFTEQMQSTEGHQGNDE